MSLKIERNANGEHDWVSQVGTVAGDSGLTNLMVDRGNFSLTPERPFFIETGDQDSVIYEVCVLNIHNPLTAEIESVVTNVISARKLRQGEEFVVNLSDGDQFKFKQIKDGETK